jgi:hypothetical protein
MDANPMINHSLWHQRVKELSCPKCGGTCGRIQGGFYCYGCERPWGPEHMRSACPFEALHGG